jgi:hypothetical protein
VLRIGRARLRPSRQFALAAGGELTLHFRLMRWADD